MLHRELNELGKKFLLTNRVNFHRYKCQYVYIEIKSAGNDEIPDVVGFYSCSSVIIESKTSRSDFLKDKQKSHRKSDGIGDFRFFLSKENLILEQDLYDDWGLLYTDGKKVWVVKEPIKRVDRTYEAERCLMYSIIRRINKKK